MRSLREIVAGKTCGRYWEARGWRYGSAVPRERPDEAVRWL